MSEREQSTRTQPNSDQLSSSSRLESLLQQLIARMEGSERRYEESLEDLHTRLEDLAHQAKSAREAGDWGSSSEFERVESQASGLADRLREAEAAYETEHGPSRSLSDIEQRITAFAEKMSASSAPPSPHTSLNEPMVDFGQEPEAPPISQQETNATREPPKPEPSFFASPEPPAAKHETSPSGEREPDAFGRPEPAPEQRFTDTGKSLHDSWPNSSATHELEAMRDEVEGLSHSFASALGQPEQPDALKSIDSRLADLARHFDQAAEQHGRMSSIEDSLRRLVDTMQTPRQLIDEAAEKAARTAAHMVAVETGTSSALERLEAIQSELRSLNERTSSMDERTVDTLETMKDTLKALAGRVSAAPDEGPDEGPQASAPAPAEPLQAEAAPALSEYLKSSQDASPAAGDEGADTELAQQLAEPRAAPAPSPEQSGSEKSSERAARARAATMSDDEFVASARRAAQAAALQAQEQNSGGFGLLKRFGNTNETDEEGEEIGDGRRSRGLLVSAAILLLLVSAALLYARLGSKDTDTGSINAPIEKPAPPASSGASSGKQGKSQPERQQDDGNRLVGRATDARSATTTVARAPASPAPEAAKAEHEAAAASSLSLPGISVEVHSAASRPAALPEKLKSDDVSRAAIEGDAAAQYEIGNRYASGNGVEEDMTQAARWYEKAAAQGFAPAQFRLATFYERGKGVPRDRGRAKAWYLRAAEQGNVNAMHNLAVLYADQTSGNPNYEIALQWFKAAAAHGLADSQFNLGILYETGLGVQKHMAKAYTWFSLAAARGDSEAKKRADNIRLQLSASALQRANQNIAAWSALPAQPQANDTAQDRDDTGGIGTTSRAVVQEAQMLLAKLGYDVGTADGRLGPKTETAIKLFQQRAGLTPNGQISDELLQHLNSRAS